MIPAIIIIIIMIAFNLFGNALRDAMNPSLRARIMNNKEIAVEVKNLSVSFRTNQGMLKAVRDVSFNLYRRNTSGGW